MYLSTLVFGGLFIAQGKMEAADLAMFALYIGIFISPVQILVELTDDPERLVRIVLVVLATEPDIQDKEDAKEIEDVSGEVEFDHVSFRYTDEAVLSDISF